ncbi:hypothetical protein D3C79_650930 [compost metagenome]
MFANHQVIGQPAFANQPEEVLALQLQQVLAQVCAVAIGKQQHALGVEHHELAGAVVVQGAGDFTAIHFQAQPAGVHVTFVQADENVQLCMLGRLMSQPKLFMG